MSDESGKTPAKVVDETLAAAADGVAIFSKSYCPYCRRAKRALLGIGIAPVVVELDERADGAAIQAEVRKRTGQRTVPSVWYNGKHIGGGDDTVAGVESGLFKDAPRASFSVDDEAKDEAGLKHCGEADGVACRCYSA